MTTETKVEAVAWPDYLMIRDTGLHDDMGGLGQRIYTTAGAGYKKEKYVRASALDALRGEVAAAERRVAELSESLARTRDAIAAAPEHSFGVHYEGDDRPSWPIRDEILHSIDAALTKESP